MAERLKASLQKSPRGCGTWLQTVRFACYFIVECESPAADRARASILDNEPLGATFRRYVREIPSYIEDEKIEKQKRNGK